MSGPWAGWNTLIAAVDQIQVVHTLLKSQFAVFDPPVVKPIQHAMDQFKEVHGPVVPHEQSQGSLRNPLSAPQVDGASQGPGSQSDLPLHAYTSSSSTVVHGKNYRANLCGMQEQAL